MTLIRSRYPLSQVPVRLRLTLWYVVLLATGLVVFAGGVYLLLSRSLVTNLDTGLQTALNQTVAAITMRHGHISLLSAAEDVDPPYIPVTLVAPTGRTISGDFPHTLRVWMRHNVASLPSHLGTQSVSGLRIATQPVTRRGHVVGYAVAWQSLRSVDEARETLFVLSSVLGAILLLLSGVGGLVLARRALHPVSQITHTASAISVTDLHRRVPVGVARDELTELAATFNDMITRLEAAVERERRFTGDASHELRSPLAVILAETSLALEESGPTSENDRVLRVIHDQASSMSEIISALLVLARAETTDHLGDRVDISTVIERASKTCAHSATARHITLTPDVVPGLAVLGNESLLTRVVTNLLVNAIQASPPHSTIRITARRAGSHIVCEVSDAGPGIPADERERIFEPFYQIARARTPGDSHGLGLAICRRIVDAHGGSIHVVADRPAGTTIRVELTAA
jgi:signal transduction histidine kinase